MAIINNNILIRTGGVSIPPTSFFSSQTIPYNGGTVVVNGTSLFPPASAIFDGQPDTGSTFFGDTQVNFQAPKSSSLNSHFINSSITINSTTVNASDDFRYHFAPIRSSAVPVDLVPYDADKFWVVFEQFGLGPTGSDGTNAFSTATSINKHVQLHSSGNIPNAFRGTSTGSKVYILSTFGALAFGNSIMWEINPIDSSIVDSVELEQPAPNNAIIGGGDYQGNTIIFNSTSGLIYIGGSGDANRTPFDVNDWGGLLIEFDPSDNSYTYIRDNSPGVTPDIPVPIFCSATDGSNMWFGGGKRLSGTFPATNDHIIHVDDTGSILDGTSYGTSNLIVRELTYNTTTGYLYAIISDGGAADVWKVVQIDISDLSIVDTITATDIFGSDVQLNGLVYSPTTELIYVSTITTSQISRIKTLDPASANNISNIVALDAVVLDGTLISSNVGFHRLVYEPTLQKVYAHTTISGSNSTELYVIE